MTGKFKPMRTSGEIPAGYDGPVYWRVRHYRWDMGNVPFRFEKKQESRLDRLIKVGDGYNFPGKTIYTSGTVFDAEGSVLPEWKVPLKAQWRLKSAMPEYQTKGRYALMSNRVFEIIDALEPNKHPAFPIDVALKDGGIERHYAVFFAEDAWLSRRELHPEANQLEPIQYTDGSWGYKIPMWITPREGDSIRFGYLDRAAIGDRHWFKGTDDNAYFSPELFEKLQALGDILSKYDIVIATGVAD